jgi:hypothetical protein
MTNIYATDDVNIPHADLLRLRHEGKIALGISRPIAERISRAPDLKPSKTTAAAAFRFWNIVAFAGFLYSVYLTFTANWWWCIVGFIGAGIVARANAGANQSNLLDAAMVDQDFYERIARLHGWQFRMAEEDAEPYFTDNFRRGRDARPNAGLAK